jgi:two-component system chemotaxis sensor kinase CheA
MLFIPNHALTFEDVVKFLPQTFQHSSKGRHIALMYRRVPDKNGHLNSIILIATDLTDETEAQLRARMQQNYVDMICRIFKERNQFMTTITHLRNFINESKTLVKRDDASSVLRLLHTLKASAKHFSLDALSNVIHKMEADLRSASIQSDEEFQARLKKGGDEVNACIESVLEQVGDLIGQDFEGRGNLREIDEDTIYEFARLMRAQGVNPDIIRQYLVAIAAVPVQEAFHQFEREIKDLAVIMGKKVKPIRFTGSNPRVLLQPMEGFLLSIMHISRNIIDHGIEPVVTRLARGKDPAGLISVHTDLVDNLQTGRKMVQILISDDGNGIDPTLVRKKLASIDPNGSWKNDSDEVVIQRIMQWEVSTRAEISDISGRGVGMEAVEREVNLLGGTIKVYSELYKGTRFDIRIPYGLDVPEKRAA